MIDGCDDIIHRHDVVARRGSKFEVKDNEDDDTNELGVVMGSYNVTVCLVNMAVVGFHIFAIFDD